ncbi:GYDIA family GHMP kinase [Algibacter sp. 2305UL17-15]|uniref:GYDIA family GHMP kinase n=1 Tax=Algibacter sp. 2305UL17-15 TaxID=3231268 RepID=UPI00345A0FBD
MKKFRSNGKLLLTGEYVVLDGALSLAVPTKYGQSLTVDNIDERQLIWQSFDEKNAVWFEHEYIFEEIAFPFIYETNMETHDGEISKTLLKILFNASRLNRDFFNEYLDDYDDEEGKKILGKGFKLSSKLEFPRHWGLGSSSTLINNIAQWLDIDPYLLLRQTFGGSGYDIACARNNEPITYRLEKGKPTVNVVDFNPVFKEHLYFVYLNKKQNSRDGIAHYKAIKTDLKPVISEIDAITKQLISCESLNEFQKLITQHETIISKLTKQDTVKSLYFNDFEGAMKSLGAWGGDFILACSEVDPTAYFKGKGFDTVIAYCDMVL